MVWVSVRACAVGPFGDGVGVGVIVAGRCRGAGSTALPAWPSALHSMVEDALDHLPECAQLTQILLVEIYLQAGAIAG